MIHFEKFEKHTVQFIPGKHTIRRKIPDDWQYRLKTHLNHRKIGGSLGNRTVASKKTKVFLSQGKQDIHYRIDLFTPLLESPSIYAGDDILY